MAATPAFPWLRAILFGFWCAAAGVLAGQLLVPAGAVPRGVGLLVLSLLIVLGLVRAAWALRASVERQGEAGYEDMKR